jgi:hypothetical protein
MEVGTSRSIRNATRKIFMPLPMRVLMVLGSGKMKSVPYKIGQSVERRNPKGVN